MLHQRTGGMTIGAGVEALRNNLLGDTFKRLGLASASLAIVSLAISSQAFAESSPTAGPQEANTAKAEDLQEIVVTGSHIVTSGAELPTPVTIVTPEELSKGTPRLLQGLSQLPQLLGSTTPENTRNAQPSQGATSGNVLNIHAIGGNRVLILLDGLRVPPTTYKGTVDSNFIPQMLVKKIDVVTAGASAAYGSDALAGVVNFLIDDDFRGLKGDLQVGTTSRNDNDNYHVGLAYGRDLTDRLHVLFSAERGVERGFRNYERPSLAGFDQAVGSVIGGGTPGTAANPWIDGKDLRWDLVPGGFNEGGIVNLGGPLTGLTFGSNGEYHTVNPGTPTGTPGFYHGGDYARFANNAFQAAPFTNNTAFTRLAYDVSENTKIYFQANGAKSLFKTVQPPSFYFYTPILSGNPFIPAALQQQLTATGTPAILFSKMYNEGGDTETKYRQKYYNLVGGAQGVIHDFHWDVAYQHSASEVRPRLNQFQNDKFSAALDAVIGPNGDIVCQPTLSSDPVVAARYAGCVPFNPFGINSGSPQAVDYVTGHAWYRARNTQNDVTASISGDLFQMWAGTVKGAVGAEYRTQRLNLTTNADLATQIDTTGLRAPAGSSPFAYQTFGTAKGDENVKEGFAEISAPLLRDLRFTKSLEANGAVRFTDYSTSGSVTTWKAGGVWTPVSDDFRFRLTRSRDIRAPTLYELFASPSQEAASFFDVHTGIQAFVPFQSSGNPDLKPEKGNTLTFGAVFQPEFIPNLTVTLDYFRTKITGSIQTLDRSVANDVCEASGGTSPTCALFVRPLPFSDTSIANFPTLVVTSPVNIAAAKINGIDAEATYLTDLGPGQLTTRFLGTFVNSYTTRATSASSKIEYAGFNENPLNGYEPPVPRFTGQVNGEYQIGAFHLFARERYIGSLKRGPTKVWAERDLPAVFYTDATVSYDVNWFGAKGGQAFLSAVNLFDKEAPYITAPTGQGIGLELNTETSLYDTAGLSFVAGVHFNF